MLEFTKEYSLFRYSGEIKLFFLLKTRNLQRQIFRGTTVFSLANVPKWVMCRYLWERDKHNLAFFPHTLTRHYSNPKIFTLFLRPFSWRENEASFGCHLSSLGFNSCLTLSLIFQFLATSSRASAWH